MKKYLTLQQNSKRTDRNFWRSALGFLFVCSFLLVNIGNIQNHLCLDGQEPAYTVHFENFNGHPTHDENDEPHNDIEYDVSVKSINGKTFQFAKFVAIVISSELLPNTETSITHTPVAATSLPPQQPKGTLPPLRAPPLLS